MVFIPDHPNPTKSLPPFESCLNAAEMRQNFPQVKSLPPKVSSDFLARIDPKNSRRDLGGYPRCYFRHLSEIATTRPLGGKLK
jgi:hypothetical protein